jgi:hypothetical protein
MLNRTRSAKSLRDGALDTSLTAVHGISTRGDMSNEPGLVGLM